MNKFLSFRNRLEPEYNNWFEKFYKTTHIDDIHIIFISDCDGILSDGKNVYNAQDKILKNYGQYDKEAIKYICDYAKDKIIFVTGDKNGFDITKKRLQDITNSCLNKSNINLELKNSEERRELISKLLIEKLSYDSNTIVVFIGDSLSDIPALSKANYGLTVNNAPTDVKYYCNYASHLNGSEGGFADCVFELYKYIAAKNAGRG